MVCVGILEHAFESVRRPTFRHVAILSEVSHDDRLQIDLNYLSTGSVEKL